MLYITTRGDKDAFTSHRTLCENVAPDGGQFVPFAMPNYTLEEIAALAELPFGQIVAQLLNQFYSAKLSGWDIDFAIGRNAAKITAMNHRIAIAELWHNPKGDFSYIANSLYHKITGGNPPAPEPTRWFVIAVRIAIFFGVYGELLRKQIITSNQLIDISVDGSDFSTLIAAWYARSMGLPIGTIICTSIDSSFLWDFIHRGVFTPNTADAPAFSCVERLVHATLGFGQAVDFADKCVSRRVFSLDEAQLALMNAGLFCCVSSQSRISSTINSLFRSNSYITDARTAFCYGGLQDYRAKTGDSVMTLLLSERLPLTDADLISSATGIEKGKLFEYINYS